MIVQEREIIETLPDADLPADWRLDTIPGLVGKDGLFLDGDWIESKDQDPNGDVRLIQLADIGDGFYRNRSDRYLTHDRAIKLGCTFLKKGDVLIARMPDPLGRACIFPGDSKKAVTAVDVCIVRPNREDVDNRWLMYFVNAPAFRAAVASLQSGSTRKRISRSNLAKIQLPVPPAQQQQRIVAEIEKQFSRLDEAVANLKRVKANLKRYKAAVLKTAVEGKLTEDWRKTHPDVEPASELLKRIQVERKKTWAAENPGKEYKEPAAPENSNLPELPDAWVWSRTDQLFHYVTSGSRGWASYYSETGPAFLRMGNLDHDTVNLDLSDIQRVQAPKGSEGMRTRVLPGDILISITADVGMVGIVPTDFEQAYINQHVALARPVTAVNHVYIAWYLAGKNGQDQLKKLQRGATKVGLGLDDIKSVDVPLPPTQEQNAIVAEIDRRFSIVGEIEAQVETNLLRAERLRQGVLKSAFTGRLVN